MKKFSLQFLYKSFFRFQILLLAIAVLPFAVLKFLLHYSIVPLEEYVNAVIICSLVIAIVGGCVYSLTNYASVNKSLKPVKQLAELGEMAARVAHDLRGPLSGIRVVQEYLQQFDSNDASSGRPFMDHINLLILSSKRLENVAHDLLKKNKGQDEEATLFSLHEVLDELIGEYQAQPVLAGVQFRKRYSKTAIPCHGRRHKIERMFDNVMKNAIESMDFEGVITVETQTIGEVIQVAIQDTGSGMNAEQVAKLMAEGFTEGKKDGHGIGLLFVREVLAEHLGRLHVDSEVKKGSRFMLELPLAHQTEGPFALEVFNREPVIVIDDDLSILEQWRMRLAELGLDVYLFDSFEEFEESPLEMKPTQTAIVDFHFGNSEVNGVEIVDRLKARGWKNIALCSGEYWKPSLKKIAEELKVVICPKPLPKLVISVIPAKAGIQKDDNPAGYTVLVIDDDPVIGMGWELMREKLHLTSLHFFPSLELLKASEVNLRSIDIAFVDKNIENSQFSGADVVTYLKSKSVPKVVLASGENAGLLREDPQFALADFVIQDKIPSSFKDFFS